MLSGSNLFRFSNLVKTLSQVLITLVATEAACLCPGEAVPCPRPFGVPTSGQLTASARTWLPLLSGASSVCRTMLGPWTGQGGPGLLGCERHRGQCSDGHGWERCNLCFCYESPDGGAGSSAAGRNHLCRQSKCVHSCMAPALRPT